MTLKKIAAVFAAVSIVSIAHAAEVIWGAAESNGVGITDAGGTPLPQGDLVLLGHFSLTPAQVIANGNNEAFLMSAFVTFATGHIGDGLPNGPGAGSNGYWEDTSIASSNALGIQHEAIDYWVFNATTANAATQYGIFTASASTNTQFAAAWMFPGDTDVPNVTVTDLSDVPHDSTGIYWGSYNGTGTSGDGISPLYYLASFSAVPEPSTWVAGTLIASSLLPTIGRRFQEIGCLLRHFFFSDDPIAVSAIGSFVFR